MTIDDVRPTGFETKKKEEELKDHKNIKGKEGEGDLRIINVINRGYADVWIKIKGIEDRQQQQQTATALQIYR